MYTGSGGETGELSTTAGGETDSKEKEENRKRELANPLQLQATKRTLK